MRDLPATCGMLADVRTELVQRIDQTREELRSEIQGVRGEIQGVRGEIQGVRGEIQEVRTEMRMGLASIRADFHTLRADVHEVKASVARIAYLVEEQNVRNKVAMEGFLALSQRQDRLEQRMDEVETTVRDLAAPRPG